MRYTSRELYLKTGRILDETAPSSKQTVYNHGGLLDNHACGAGLIQCRHIITYKTEPF